uniref:Coiled-coil domain-containing protein 22 n=1 Tax=Ciona savignyi TaxID=51511 RepID=H2Z6Y4_CIOSA
MEEVDQIIIGSLLNIGCEFAEGMTSLKQFTTENVVEATVKCLRIINPDYKMSHIFPPGMSARFRVGTSIANTCKSIGYQGDIGYQTFLYSAERDVRQIFMFLVEKLPRKEGVKEDTVQTVAESNVLQRRIGQVLREKCSTMWMPFYCKPLIEGVPFRTQPLFIPKYSKGHRNSKSQGKRQNEKKYDYIHRQVEHDELTPSLLELNCSQLIAASPTIGKTSKQGDMKTTKVTKEAFHWKDKSMDKHKPLQIRPVIPQKPSHLAKLENKEVFYLSSLDWGSDYFRTGFVITWQSYRTQDDPTSSVDEASSSADVAKDQEELEEIRFQREEDEMNKMISDVVEDEEKYKEDLKMVEMSMKQIVVNTQELESTNEERIKQVKLKEKTLKLLPNAEENMEKLKAMVDASSQRLVELGKLWEEKRIPLVAEIRRLKQSKTETEFDAERKVEEIRLLRSRMKDVSEETKQKDQLIKQLKTELDSVKRDISRQSYTRRILEIVASIHKQKQEIQRVIEDVKLVQKTMNKLKGRANRTFSAADEVIFRDAKQDEGSKQAYKYLVSLHDNCAALLKTVEETGLIMREIRDLEGQIDIEIGKNAEENLEKILKDYKEVKRENAEMIKKLKKK